MVYSLVQNFRYALKYRGGWKGLFEHMYSVRTYGSLAGWNFLVFFGLTSDCPSVDSSTRLNREGYWL